MQCTVSALNEPISWRGRVMNVADETPAGCELQQHAHADVGPLYQL